MCVIFKIFLDFKEVVIENVSEELENQQVEISLEFLGNKLNPLNEDFILLTDGCYTIKHDYVLQTRCSTENEDFAFQVFGSLLKIQLEPKMSPDKKAKPSIAEGFINLLHNLERTRRSCIRIHQVHFKVFSSESIKINLKYEVRCENLPVINSTLAIQLVSIHNFIVPENENIEACFRFPFDLNFRAALMQIFSHGHEELPFLLNAFLKEHNFSVDENRSNLNLYYQNFQNLRGMNLLHELIKNNRKMLIEMRINDKMFMTFIDMTIFNHPGVCTACFFLPLYEWNNKLILEQFEQESCLTIEPNVTTKKRRSKKSIRDDGIVTSNDALTPIFIDEKPVAVKVILTLSKPVYDEDSLEFMYEKLNEKFPFIIEVDEEKFALDQSKNDFRCTVKRIASQLEGLISQKTELNENELIENLKGFISSPEFCLRDEFKETLKNLIGNTYNKENPTFTNHDFKMLIIKAFKGLCHDMEEILIERQIRNLASPKILLSENTLKWQLEEYIENQNYEKAEMLLEREFPNNLNEATLKEEALYLFKLKKYDKLEKVLKKSLRVHKYCTFSLYFLLYLFVTRNDIEGSTLILTILTKLKPNSMEYWILLSSLYESIKNVPGQLFCEIKIQDSKFIPIQRSNDQIKYPEIILINPLENILWNQISYSTPEFMKMTQDFSKNNVTNIFDEDLILKVIQLIENLKYQEALSQLKEIIMTDDNEHILRILKGNILYEINGDKWKAVCEYEIAFHIASKCDFQIKFPLIPALRCGQYFLNETENESKSYKYFQYCCNNFGTFDSLMGLGKVHLIRKDYYCAEKCFIDANSIDPMSQETWIFLALTESKLKRHDLTLNCYFRAKELGMNYTKEVEEIEQFLDL